MHRYGQFDHLPRRSTTVRLGTAAVCTQKTAARGHAVHAMPPTAPSAERPHPHPAHCPGTVDTPLVVASMARTTQCTAHLCNGVQLIRCGSDTWLDIKHLDCLNFGCSRSRGVWVAFATTTWSAHTAGLVFMGGILFTSALHSTT